MKILHRIRKLGLVPEHKLLEWFPPFWFMGVKIIEVATDYRRLEARLPLRSYGMNGHGSMFGGFISAAADPLPAVLCARIFPDCECWTRNLSVDFLKPAITALTIRIHITDADLEDIRAQLAAKGKATHAFQFNMTNPDGSPIVDVTNTVYLRKRERTLPVGK